MTADRPSRQWTDMTPEEFGHTPQPVQGALFPDRDDCGTPDMFDTAGDDADKPR